MRKICHKGKYSDGRVLCLFYLFLGTAISCAACQASPMQAR